MMYAEDANFWKTGKSSADVWVERTKKQIETLGGTVISEAFGSADGKAAFALTFSVKGDRFRIIWPVLPASGRDDDKAAKIQAATMLYHWTKMMCLRALIVGARETFFSNLLLEDGRVASQVATAELTKMTPKFLLEAK